MSVPTTHRITCDTSVLIPALVEWHEFHELCRPVLDEVSHIPGHVLLESYSVLTRLPAPHRIPEREASALIGGLPWPPIALPVDLVPDLVGSLGPRGIKGGAAYDALIAMTATHHGCELVTRDERAVRSYDMVGPAYRFLGSPT